MDNWSEILNVLNLTGEELAELNRVRAEQIKLNMNAEA